MKQLQTLTKVRSYVAVNEALRWLLFESERHLAPTLLYFLTRVNETNPRMPKKQTH